MAIGKLIGKVVSKATKPKKKPKIAPKPKAEETFESEMKALRSKAMTPAAREAEAKKIAEKYGKPAPAKKKTKKTKKAKKLSPDKARRDLAVVGKKAQDMMTSLRAKKDKLAKMLRDGAAPDAIERQRAAIKDMEDRMGPVLKEQVRRRKVKPIPKGDKKKPATPAPRQKAPAEIRPIPAALIAAARAAKGPTFTYKGKKYSKAVILKGEKKMASGGMSKKGVPVITVGVGMMPAPKGKKPRTGSKDFRNGGMVTETKSNLKPIPPGKKGKGLSMLPESARNNMGFMKKGGMVKK